MRILPPALWGFVALAPAILVVDAVRQGVESRMTLHMLVELPLLLAAGWALGRGPWRLRLLPARVDLHGLLGIAIASCVMSFWMIPAALDLSLLSEPVRWAKYVSWIAAGVALSDSAPRLRDETAVFFAGNLAWMLATAGLLYRESEQRLCVSYLLDDQLWTGNGLLAAAAGSLVLVAWRMRRQAVAGAA